MRGITVNEFRPQIMFFVLLIGVSFLIYRISKKRENSFFVPEIFTIICTLSLDIFLFSPPDGLLDTILAHFLIIFGGGGLVRLYAKGFLNI
jgi:hypothetical protein